MTRRMVLLTAALRLSLDALSSAAIGDAAEETVRGERAL